MAKQRTRLTFYMEEQADKFMTILPPEREGVKVSEKAVELNVIPSTLEPDEYTPGMNGAHPDNSEYRYRYGVWFRQVKPDFERCCVEVSGPGIGKVHQCTRKARFDLDCGKPTRCKMHSREALKKKREEREAKYSREKAQREAAAQLRAAKDAALELVKSIAEGHNDARGACMALLREYGQ